MKLFYRFLLIYFLLCTSLWAAETTAPSSLKDFLQKTEVSGRVRSYYFIRNYGNSVNPDEWAYSLGGMLNLKSADIDGFSADAAYYAADSFNIEAANPDKRDRTLPPGGVNVLGQAYLQYQKSKWIIRVGDQQINTPWINPADSRMIPATYQGIFAAFKPIPAIELNAFRLFQYKDRTATRFTRTNLYTPDTPGGTPVPALSHVGVPGVLAAGAIYDLHHLKLNAWYYQFYDFGNLVYADAEYIFKNTPVSPVVAAQVGGEWGDGKNYLDQAGLGDTNATIYGVLMGLQMDHGRVALSYNILPTRYSAYRSGDVVSPYTSGYMADPLYTTSMISGLVEKRAGHGFNLDGYYYLFADQLRIEMSYAQYAVAAPEHDTNEVDFDVGYEFKQHVLKGLSVRNRIGILNGDLERGRFVYERMMIEYSF